MEINFSDFESIIEIFEIFADDDLVIVTNNKINMNCFKNKLTSNFTILKNIENLNLNITDLKKFIAWGKTYLKNKKPKKTKTQTNSIITPIYLYTDEKVTKFTYDNFEHISRKADPEDIKVKPPIFGKLICSIDITENVLDVLKSTLYKDSKIYIGFNSEIKFIKSESNAINFESSDNSEIIEITLNGLNCITMAEFKIEIFNKEKNYYIVYTIKSDDLNIFQFYEKTQRKSKLDFFI